MAEPTVLDTIVAKRREDVREAKVAVPAGELERRLVGAPAAIASRPAADAPMADHRGEAGVAEQGDIARMDAAARAMKTRAAGAAREYPC